MTKSEKISLAAWLLLMAGLLIADRFIHINEIILELIK